MLLKLGEIVLKGQNRGNFEKRLMKNLAWRIRNFGEFKISCMQSTIYVEPQDESCDMDAAFSAAEASFSATEPERISSVFPGWW